METLEAPQAPTTELPTPEACQGTEPLAWIAGEPFVELPKDLYIPPDALKVFLEAFSGPLDLLLYLIRKENLDIMAISITQVTEQYLQYINLMRSLEMGLAAEYLAMAATLAEIKSYLLLPKPEAQEDLDDALDPRAALVARLQAYEQIKHAAMQLEALPQSERDFTSTHVKVGHYVAPECLPQVQLPDLLKALAKVLQRAAANQAHQVLREPLSVRARMTRVLSSLGAGERLAFEACFDSTEGRPGVVVSFMAILELQKQAVIMIVQDQQNGPIWIARREAHV